MRNSAHQQCWAFVFLLIYSGQSIPVHFGSFRQPCHWLKRLHLVIRWGKICFLVILQCSQTICFSGWSRHWKSWYFFSRSTRHDINSLGEHGKIVWRHIHCPRQYLVRRAAKNVISPPQTPPKKQQCKKSRVSCKLACARVRCKRRVDSVAASPREYLVRRAAKNVISPPKTPPKTPKTHGRL